MSRESKTSELKQRVLNAALTQFSERGVEHTNVEAILKAADVSVGSLYHHFGNKEGIAEALLVHGLISFHGALLKALLTHRKAEPGVKAIVKSSCRWVTEHPQLAAFLLSREITLSDATQLELREQDRNYRDALTRWFTPHIESGELKNLHFNVYVSLISGPTLEYSRRWLSGRYNRSPDTVANIMAEAAWQSVREA